jgi:hypothetical protein
VFKYYAIEGYSSMVGPIPIFILTRRARQAGAI